MRSRCWLSGMFYGWGMMFVNLGSYLAAVFCFACSLSCYFWMVCGANVSEEGVRP